MSPLVFVRLGADLFLRLDTIVAAEEETYSSGPRTRIHVLGKKESLWYDGALEDVESAIQRAAERVAGL